MKKIFLPGLLTCVNECQSIERYTIPMKQKTYRNSDTSTHRSIKDIARHVGFFLAAALVVSMVQSCTGTPVASFENESYGSLSAVPLVPPLDGDWSSVLAELQPVGMHRARSGYLTVKRSQLNNLALYPEGTDRTDRLITVDIQSLVFVLPSGDVILVDTGIGSAFDTRKTGTISGLLAAAILPPIVWDGTDSPFSIITRLQLPTPSAIVLTHLHFDHVNGLADFPVDIPIVYHEKEKHIDIPLLFEDPSLRSRPIGTLMSTHGGTREPFSEVWDVFGNGCLLAVSLPGHSPGHIGFLFCTETANNERQYYLFVGDALTAEAYGYGSGPGSFSARLDDAHKTAQAIRSFIAAHSGVELLFAHSERQ